MAINFQILRNQPSDLDFNLASSNDGWILMPDSTLRHNSTKTTSVTKAFNNYFVVNTNYKLTFEVSNYISCDVSVVVGNRAPEVFSGNGIKTYFFIADSESENVTFISNGFLDITEVKIDVIQPNTQFVEFNNTDEFINKSFTVSYDLINKKWISYHEYLPSNYIRHNTDYIKFEDSSELEISGSKDKKLKAIIELVQNEYPSSTKVLDSVIVNCESRNIEEENINSFFDKILIYTNDQSTGEIELNSSNITKKEENWNFNKILDISKQESNLKVMTEEWDKIKNNYYIDKVSNVDSLDLSKPWHKRGRLRNKYFTIRFFYENLENSKIFINFVNTHYRISQR